MPPQARALTRGSPQALTQLPPLAAAALLGAVPPAAAAQVLGSDAVSVEFAAAMLEMLPPAAAAAVLELVEPTRAGALLAEMPPVAAANVLAAMDTQAAARALAAAPEGVAVQALARLPPAVAAEVAAVLDAGATTCAGLEELQLNLVVAPAEGGAAYDMRASIYNGGAAFADLEGVTLRGNFSRWVRADDGSMLWATAPSADFAVACEELVLPDQPVPSVDLCAAATVEVAGDAFALTLPAGLALCGDCALRARLSLRHTGGLAMAPDAVAPAQTLGCRKGQAGAGDGVEAAAGPDAPGDEKVVGLADVPAVADALRVAWAPALDGARYVLEGKVTNALPDANVDVAGLAVPVQFSPWVQGPDGLWSEASFDQFVVECVRLVADADPAEDLCGLVEFEAADDGVTVVFGSHVLCPGCSLSATLAIAHKDADVALDPRPPVVGPAFVAGGGGGAAAMAVEGVASAGDVAPATCTAGTLACPAGTAAPAAVQPRFEAQSSAALPKSVLAVEARSSFEQYATGTMLNAADGPVCLEGVAVLFAFPLAVEAADGSVIEAAPEDFVVTCDAVKVAGPEPVLDAPCEAMAALQMTPEGVLMTFRGVDLCPGCWLVGGANGWFFSVAHRAGLPFAPMAPQPPQCPA